MPENDEDPPPQRQPDDTADLPDLPDLPDGDATQESAQVGAWAGRAQVRSGAPDPATAPADQWDQEQPAVTGPERRWWLPVVLAVVAVVMVGVLGAGIWLIVQGVRGDPAPAGTSSPSATPTGSPTTQVPQPGGPAPSAPPPQTGEPTPTGEPSPTPPPVPDSPTAPPEPTGAPAPTSAGTGNGETGAQQTDSGQDERNRDGGGDGGGDAARTSPTVVTRAGAAARP